MYILVMLEQVVLIHYLGPLELPQKLVVGSIRTCTKYEASCSAHIRLELVE
jgi:hypothetical protein